MLFDLDLDQNIEDVTLELISWYWRLPFWWRHSRKTSDWFIRVHSHSLIDRRGIQYHIWTNSAQKGK